MKIEEIRQMSVDELEQVLDDKIEELQNLWFQHATHQLNDPTKIRQAKRDIARMKTVLNEYRKSISQPSREVGMESVENQA